MGTISIIRKLDERGKEQVVDIMYEAFELKILRLEIITKTEEQAKRVIRQSLNFDTGFYAMEKGEIVGIAFVDTQTIPCFPFDWQLFRREFGWLGAKFRKHIYTITHHKPKEDELYLNMLAVSGKDRGKGIGTLLLKEVDDFARKSGLSRVTLEVVDTNPRAQALYQRVGYQVKKVSNCGFFTRPAGFTKAILMEKIP